MDHYSGQIQSFRAGVRRENMKKYFNSGQTTNGTLVFYLTDDATAEGNALFTAMPMISFEFNDSTGLVAKSWTLSEDFKTLTVTAKKQTFSGLTILGQQVLGTVSMQNVPDGTVININAEGN